MVADLYAWERQPGESSKAYEAFSIYYKETGRRSLRNVAATLGKSETLISRWSGRWNWVERAAAYDNALAREDFKNAMEEVKRMNAQQARIGVAIQEKAIRALQKMNIDDMSARDVIQFFVHGSEIERKARLYGANLGKQEREGIQTSGIFNEMGPQIVEDIPDV